ncbi:MAG: cytochrome c [Halothiobacillaceae bacterium]
MRTRFLLTTAVVMTLMGCGGGGGATTVNGDTPPPTDTVVTPPPTDTVIAPPPTETVIAPASSTGRLLASNCFQCHATNGVGGFERITGGEAGEVWEYRGEIAANDIMAAHAQGYSDAQLNAIVTYLNQVN